MRKNKSARRNIRLFAALLFALAFAIVAVTYKVHVLDRREKFQYEKPASWVFHERLAKFARETDAGLTPRPEDRDLEKALERVNRFTELIAQVKPIAEANKRVLIAAGCAVSGEREELEEHWDALAALCESHRELLQSIRDEAALGGPVRLIEFDFTDDHKKPLNESLHTIIWMVRWLEGSAIIHAQAGNVEAVIADVIALMDLGDALRGEPFYVANSIRESTYSIAVSAVTETMPPGTVSADHTRLLAARLSGAYDLEAYIDGLISLGLYFQMRSGDKWMSGAPRPVLEVLAPIVNARERGLYARVMNRIIEVARLPYYEAVEELRPLDAEAEEIPDVYFNIVPSLAKRTLFEPRVSFRLEMNARFKALLDISRLGLLAEDHYRQNGTYPESLDVFATEFGGAIPADPFSGKPYIYEPNPQGILLYSAGPNGRDDGGRLNYNDGYDDRVWRRWMRKTSE